jgi:hypothetical protein
MPIPFSSRPLLALPLMAPLLGCASKPAEPSIVLRPPHTTKAAVHRPPAPSKQETRTVSAPASLAPASPAPSPAPSSPGAQAETPAPEQKALTSEQKEALFRDFDAYLNQQSRH